MIKDELIELFMNLIRTYSNCMEDNVQLDIFVLNLKARQFPRQTNL